jgi:hypothetical protein
MAMQRRLGVTTTDNGRDDTLRLVVSGRVSQGLCVGERSDPLAPHVGLEPLN